MSFISNAIGDVIGGITGSKQSSKAATKAADAQAATADKAIAFQKDQLAQARGYEQPYVDAGTKALTNQLDLLGLNGSGAQGTALGAVQSSPLLAALNQQGEDGILANAAATGGLRGGNTQDALSRLRSANYATAYQQLLGGIGGVTSLGQNAASLSGNNGLTAANSISDLLGIQGRAQGAAIQAKGNTVANNFSSALNLASTVAGFL